tara:strand:- start:393 stop:710 length:318 start_codon:yes stop_codon:yes gene_type:complete
MKSKNDLVDVSKGSCEMSFLQRELYLRIVDGDPRVMPIVHQIHNYRYSVDISRWLYENQITGKILLDFLKVSFENSIMGMVKFIIMKINRAKEIKPIYVNKDYKI